MRLLLVQPPFTIYKSEAKSCHPPLGLAYLYAVLKDKHQVSVLDAVAEGFENERKETRDFMTYGLSFTEIKDKIRDYAPDIVGVSWAFSNQSENVHKVCAIAKETNSRIITIVGGAHPSALPQEALQDENIDYAIIGEAEYSLQSLLQEIEREKRLLSTEGMAYRKNGDVIINPKSNYIGELDKLPFPYWQAFPLEKYFRINRPHGGNARRTPFMSIITSRGCPFECIFCSIHKVWGRSFRKRSAENVLSELEHLVKNFGVKEIMFEDDNLTLEKAHCTSMFKGIIQKNLDFIWSAPNGIAIRTIDEETLSLMKDSGCYSLSFAVESGDEYVLSQIIKKPLLLAKVKPLVEKAKSLGLEINIFFVVGFPGEGRRQIKNTFSFARKLKVNNINFFFATPLPGTKLYKICRERGLISPDFDYRYLKSNRPSFGTEEFSPAQLQRMVFREKLILYFLSLLFNPHDFTAKLWRKLKASPVYVFKLAYRYFKIGLFGEKEKTSAVKKDMNSVKDTERAYGLLWQKSKDVLLPNKYHFNVVQEIVDEPIVRGERGIDIGSGNGCDTYLMARNNPSVKIVSIDLSDGVYNTKELTSKLANVQIIKCSILDTPMKDNIFDFAYSYGVLHHTVNPQKGLLEIARILKKSSPAFLYFYEDHSGNLVKFIAVTLIAKLRTITVKMHPKAVYILSWIFSPLVFVLFSLPSKILRQFRPAQNLTNKMPFNFGSTPFSLRGDLYDRFSAPIEHRFKRQELYNLFNGCGFRNVSVVRLKDRSGWIAWGYKNDA